MIKKSYLIRKKKIEILNVNNELIVDKKGKKKIYFIDSKAKKNERWAVNLGCTAGLNLGYKFSLEQNYDYLARIDCDFIITKDYLGNVFLPEWDFNGIGTLERGFGYQIKISEAINEFNLCNP